MYSARVYNLIVARLSMLVFGTCSPGENDEHVGVYLKANEIPGLVQSNALIGKPVKIEHCGQSVGRVVSAWQHGDRLDCVFRLNDDSIDGVFAQEFVKNRRCPELSLSYSVTMQHSKDGTLSGGGKEMIEVSLVRKGARDNCRIYGHS